MKLFKYIVIYICIANKVLFSMNDGSWNLERNLPPQITLEGRFVGFKKPRKSESKFVRADTSTFYSKRTPGEKRTRKYWNNNALSNDEIKKKFDILLNRLPHAKIDKETEESVIFIDLTQDDSDSEIITDEPLPKGDVNSAEISLDNRICTDQSKIKKKTKIPIRKVKRRKIDNDNADKHGKELFSEKIGQQEHKTETEKEQPLEDMKEGKEKTFFAKIADTPLRIIPRLTYRLVSGNDGNHQPIIKEKQTEDIEKADKKRKKESYYDGSLLSVVLKRLDEAEQEPQREKEKIESLITHKIQRHERYSSSEDEMGCGSIHDGNEGELKIVDAVDTAC